MAAHLFGAALDITPASQLANPPTAKAKNGKHNARTDRIELEEYGHFSANSGRPDSAAITPAGPHTPYGAHTPRNTGAQTPKTPNELEMSRPPSPKMDEAASVTPSFSYPAMNKWRVLSACLVYFGNGMNDSAPGALIPYMESGYSIGYAVVSLIFVTNAVGFITAAFFTDTVSGRLGRARSLMTSEVIMIAGYTIIACTPPFPVVVVAFFFLGLGYALNLALNNVFCANLANSTVILGAAHGSYGIGGILGPLISTALVSNGIIWSRFYIITVGIRLVCLAFVGWAFWNYEKEDTTQFNNSLELIASRQRAADLTEPTNMQLLKRALKNKITIIGALFIFAYQGAEVSESGWVISYLINYRGGAPAKVGYVTSGFWAGITLGRFVLSHAAIRIGEKRFVYGLGVGAIAFQLLVWFVPNLIGEAVAVAIVGLLLGPIYPCAQTVFVRSLPKSIQTTSISFVSSGGSSGGAVAPFVTGLLAQAVGTFVLNPICVGLFVVMMGMWALLPKVHRRKD